ATLLPPGTPFPRDPSAARQAGTGKMKSRSTLRFTEFWHASQLRDMRVRARETGTTYGNNQAVERAARKWGDNAGQLRDMRLRARMRRITRRETCPVRSRAADSGVLEVGSRNSAPQPHPLDRASIRRPTVSTIATIDGRSGGG